MVNRPQGNAEEVQKAQDMLNRVIKAMRECQEALEQAKVAAAELKAQEDAHNAKTEQLKAKCETGGLVQRNRAKNELAQHLGEDPLPVRILLWCEW